MLNLTIPSGLTDGVKRKMIQYGYWEGEAVRCFCPEGSNSTRMYVYKERRDDGDFKCPFCKKTHDQILDFMISTKIPEWQALEVEEAAALARLNASGSSSHSVSSMSSGSNGTDKTKPFEQGFYPNVVKLFSEKPTECGANEDLIGRDPNEAGDMFFEKYKILASPTKGIFLDLIRNAKSSDEVLSNLLDIANERASFQQQKPK